MTETASFGESPEASFGDYVSLMKPRVMSLVVLTAMAGMICAPVAVHPFVGFAAILFIAIGGGASGALNMWWDADIDRVMRRTRARAVPSGRVTPEGALALGLGLAGLACLMLGLAANWFAAGLLAFTIFFYVVIYTMWLKRLTPQNIVIGGAAGAFPPMIGWAVATGGVSLESVMMFAVIFVWTPPHFWSLSLFMNDDYTRAGVPMLTVTHGKRAARGHILAYALALVPVALGLGLTSVGGPFYMAVAVALDLAFVAGAWRLWRRDEVAAEADRYRAEKAFFRFSLLYVFALFVALLIEAALIQAGIGGW